MVRLGREGVLFLGLETEDIARKVESTNLAAPISKDLKAAANGREHRLEPRHVDWALAKSPRVLIE